MSSLGCSTRKDNKNGAVAKAPPRFFARVVLATSVARYVLEQGDVTRALDRDGQFPLLASGAMCLASRKNLPALIETHLKTLDVLVIDHFVVGKNGLLAPARSATPSTARPTGLATISAWSRRTITSGACSEA